MFLLLQDRPAGIENTFLVPLTPWTQFLAIFLNLSLVAHVVPETFPEMSVWIVLGKQGAIDLYHQIAVLSMLPEYKCIVRG